MSIPRLILVMISALSVMLTLVILRSETVRIRYTTVKAERDCESLDQDIRERQLELARIGNPSILRERLKDIKGPGVSGTASSQPAREHPKPAEPSKPRKP